MCQPKFSPVLPEAQGIGRSQNLSSVKKHPLDDTLAHPPKKASLLVGSSVAASFPSLDLSPVTQEFYSKDSLPQTGPKSVKQLRASLMCAGVKGGGEEGATLTPLYEAPGKRLPKEANNPESKTRESKTFRDRLTLGRCFRHWGGCFCVINEEA